MRLFRLGLLVADFGRVAAARGVHAGKSCGGLLVYILGNASR
jgi:hypothetical protein